MGDAGWRVQRKLVGEARVVFDVGAGVGKTVVRYLKQFGLATVYAFEPVPEHFNELKQAVRRHKDRHRVKLFRAAVLDTVGTVTLNLNVAGGTHSILECTEVWQRGFQTAKGLRQSEPAGTIEVPTVTIDHFCAKHSIEAIDLLKMDIQGSELLALQGAQQMLRKKRIGVIFTEVNLFPYYKGQPTFDELKDFLAQYGFNYHSMPEQHGDGYGNLMYGDAVFVWKKWKRRP